MGNLTSIIFHFPQQTTTSVGITSTSISIATSSPIVTSIPTKVISTSATPTQTTIVVPTSTGVSVGAKILIIAKDATTEAFSAYSGLQGYGIPYEILAVPSTGATLPSLNSSTTAGNYGGIVISSDVSYDYGGTYNSALTTAQWQQLYDYQTAFGVRMVRLDVYPGSGFGTTVASASGGCCASGVEQLMSFTNTSSFSTAGLKVGATISTQGLWHYPATITDATTTWQIAKFGPGGGYNSDTVAAVINQFANGNGNRQQMAFFTSFATNWNAGSNFLMHAWIHWVTRGLYVGFRRIHLNTQIDDVHLITDLYQPAGQTFRVRAADLAAHVSWTTQINAKMPLGSKYFIELGHNGNGNIDNATLGDTRNICNPQEAVYYDQPESTGGLEFQKPLGSGTDLWPTTPTSYQWSLACSKLDPLFSWLVQPANMNAFSHVSHTFTHEALNNATYSDTSKEIRFNQAWLSTTGIAKANLFSGSGIIPPAITGLHNGDAIKAFLDNGIKWVVGDNTRPVLMNTENSFWPLTTTVEANGYAGLEIIPRWSTIIYFNCDMPDCTLQEWINTSAGSGNFTSLIDNVRATNTRYLLGLHQDPYMFHQANMRQTDMPQTNVNGVSSKLSLLQVWVETVVQEMVRLVDWPIVTLKHDDIAQAFIQRRTRDQCKPQLAWNYSADRKQILGATVSTAAEIGNKCDATIPVTFPGQVVSTNGGTTEQLGSDPLTVWVKLTGSPVSFTLKTPITL